MRILGPSSEGEMLAVFLRAELDSRRYGQTLRDLLARDGKSVESLTDPEYARRLLDEYRGYERRIGLFGGFPREVDWFRAELTRDELLDILYIDWDWWLRISDGTRSPRVAAQLIRAGKVPGSTAEEHEPFVAKPQPELIAVTTPAHAPLVLLEGHVRLTAYALFPERVPDELELLLGVSDEMQSWSNF
jgi:hypothetical protein